MKSKTISLALLLAGLLGFSGGMIIFYTTSISAGTTLIQMGIPYIAVGAVSLGIIFRNNNSLKVSIIPLLFTISSVVLLGVMMKEFSYLPHWIGAVLNNSTYIWVLVPSGVSLAFTLGFVSSKRDQWLITGIFGILLLPLVATGVQTVQTMTPGISLRYIYPRVFATGTGTLLGIPLYWWGTRLRNNINLEAVSSTPKVLLCSVICCLQVVLLVMGLSLHRPQLASQAYLLLVAVSILPPMFAIIKISSSQSIVS